MGEPEDDRNENRGSRASLAALLVIVLLVVAGWFLVQKLKAMSELQDCIMSGRTNCAPIATPPN